MTTVPACPADGIALRTLCTLLDRSGRRRVRLGCCPDCGHITYIDRPTKEWVDGYYLSAWDAHELEARCQPAAEKAGARLPKKRRGSRSRSRWTSIGPAVCEIGCGYGAN